MMDGLFKDTINLYAPIVDHVPHLERLAYDFTDAQNKRQFSYPSAIWDRVAPNFRSEPECTSKVQVGIVEYLAEAKALFEAKPELFIDIEDISTTLDLKVRVAEVYMNLVGTGWSPGVVRRSVGILGFRFTEGRWICVSYRGFKGMAVE